MRKGQKNIQNDMGGSATFEFLYQLATMSFVFA